MKKIYTKEEIQALAKSAIGKTFKELKRRTENSDEKTSNKGRFGQLLETDLYGYEINSNAEADFKEAGIELKVTPYIRNKNGTLSAKERLSLNHINFKEEYKNTFETSSFWKKNKCLQIIWYLAKNSIPKEDQIITHEILYTYPEEDLKIIKKDYEYIINKIKEGKAHELSESDTMYLGACTKGNKNTPLKEQPFSNIKARQRAFSLRQSYMTILVRKYIGNCEDVEKVLKNNNVTFNEFIENVINKYKGKTQKELMEELHIKSTSKSLNSMIISRMFNVKSNLRNTDEFQKANIIPRTIRIEENGRIKESMPFPYFSFESIANETWETSQIKEEFENTKYMFFLFKKDKNDYVFQGIKLWNMPQSIVDKDIKEVWSKTNEVIKSGNIVNHIDKRGRRITNFPKISDNKISHVRPHAQNSDDTLKLPVKDNLTGATNYTKQCFWLNNKYLEEILKEFL